MVRRARITIVAGLMLVLAGFGLGVQPMSATVGQETLDCRTAIPTSWLMSGATVEPAARPANASERRQQAACQPVVTRTRLLTGGLLGLGAVLLLGAWTVIREDGSASRSHLAPDPV